MIITPLLITAALSLGLSFAVFYLRARIQGTSPPPDPGR
jgi:hypothetical protein